MIGNYILIKYIYEYTKIIKYKSFLLRVVKLHEITLYDKFYIYHIISKL